MTATDVASDPAASADRSAPVEDRPSPTGRLRRFGWGLVRGRADDPAWVRPALLALLGATALLYLWSLSESGWANAYYAAAVQAGSSSWKAFLFGSSDGSNFITVDKAPGFLWPMDLSARIFGVSSWSILVPQALEGVATVGVLYAAVRRWFGPVAGLLAGAVAALTPVAVLMFRFNNPDALLVLLMTLGAYAVVRAIESGATRWVVLFGALVGFAFLAKMLQAFLVLPAFGFAYLLAAPVPFWRRVRQLALAAVAMVAAGGWWVALVELWPASSRPYIGGSEDNSVLNLIFGYNGFGRLTGDEVGSVGGGPAGTAGRWGSTGLGRLFDAEYGGQASWLIPAALLLLVVLLVATVRAPRTDRSRAAAVLWGGWLVVTGLAISLGEGIIHPYYTVALVPAVGALVGIGAVWLWQRRSQLWSRLAAAVVIAVSAWWSHELLERTPDWRPHLRTFVLAAGIGLAVLIVLAAQAMARNAAGVVAAAVFAVVLAGPAAYTQATVTTAHTGALPSAGPAQIGFGFRGGGARPGNLGGGRFPPLGRLGNGQAPPGLGTNLPQPGQQSGSNDGNSIGNNPSDTAGTGGTSGNPFPFPSGGIGGILGASEPSAELTKLLSTDGDEYTWVAATVSANQAAGYQLATGYPVMAMGGFNGTDPTPTLAEFEDFVAAGRIHYFIAGGGMGLGRGGAGGAAGGGTSDSGEISTWVEQHYDAITVGGTVIYDLTA